MDSETIEKTIAYLPEAIQTDLKKILKKGARISSMYVFNWMKILGLDDVHALMLKLIPLAKAYARAPTSNFHVGAVALAESGDLYLGANMEVPNESTILTVHAEQSAVLHAWHHRETIQSIAVSASPCGCCRQFLNELKNTKTLNIIVNEQDGYTVKKLKALLPDAFEPKDLGLKSSLTDHDQHELEIAAHINEPGASLALLEAKSSYAPYTNNFAAICIVLSESEKLFVGRLCENAAFNPAVSPLQSALVIANMSLPPQTKLEILSATLVEQKGKTSQQGITEAILKAIAPGIALKTILATPAEKKPESSSSVLTHGFF